MRLIDANALKEDLKQYYPEEVLNGVTAKTTFNQILHDIDNAPTVSPDMAQVLAYENGKASNERPAAEWIQKCDDNFDWYECSCCGYGDEGELEKRPGFRFCPNCGSKMMEVE